MALTITQQGQVLVFRGELDRETLLDYLPFTLLKSLSGQVVFDFSALTNVDSAGLAWLIEQLALAQQRDLQLQIRQAPAQLLSLARVSAVADLLPIVD
ncbi:MULTISPECIES: lipid asymmetry maintenance protein MlaB [Alishewanella]|uniref:Anti-sigma-factor antagonist n=2 Tax=Alishewanella TaxID=111142 RepID=H3ZD33_9ALTE|nr:MULTISPECIES: STAS domain-containing protein [Alishewanella]EHR41466.1 anti-sigma-factor antagonist [Alishewanella jeotgali KCTC 22429]EJI86609.1 anti-sigma-factor antagonist [Alishewanella aestuarii B11]MCT8127180.1 STAS domain-containing protein [Alishewanella sp. BS5-314]OCW97252.1 NTP-binding protein [Alishewanella sp. HH-ZS]